MQTEAVFDKIPVRIQEEISKAEKSIFISVDWFTNKNLFEELVNKARIGCSISLIISKGQFNQNSSIDFERLNLLRSKVYWVGEGNTELMHHKFCVIDYNTVITGSYNWSCEPVINFDNVIITSGDTALAEQFISEFRTIIKLNYPNAQKEDVIFPLNKIIKRLEILKNYIVLEDIDELGKESSKLGAFSFNSDINAITIDLKNQQYSEAIRKIENFISKNNQILVWLDPEISALKLEIKNLENQLNSFDNERIELEKFLTEFQHRHTIELGEIILEILKLRKHKFINDKQKAEEAEKDYYQFYEQVEREKIKQQFELTDLEKKELKAKFRKASFLCHPDKVNDEFKEAAQKIFIELIAAYEINDLKKVTEILFDLEKGNYFKTQSDTFAVKDKLKVAIAKLKHQIQTIEEEIIDIKRSETFRTIIEIDNWDEYFNRTREKLRLELEQLKFELEIEGDWNK